MAELGEAIPFRKMRYFFARRTLSFAGICVHSWLRFVKNDVSSPKRVFCRQVKSEWLVSASPVPSSAPTTTSLRKCMPSKMRDVAITMAQTSNAGSSAG